MVYLTIMDIWLAMNIVIITLNLLIKGGRYD